MTTLVLGAGISGIAAAHDLKKGGQAVTVLEARDRIGGRIYTRRDIVNGVPVELGAEFLHGERVPLWDFVEDLNLQTVHWEKMDDSLVRMEDDRLLTMREARTADPDFDLTRTWKLPSVPVRSEDDDLYHYLSRLGFTKAQLQYTRRSFANATGESIHRISAAAAVEEMQDESFGEEDWRILDGYDTIVQYLAIGLDVRLNTTVKLVEWSGEVIKVTAEDGTVFECERLVLAVPVGVFTANSITFDPPLPEGKMNVLRDLSMGPGLKLVYVFDEPVLPAGIGALYSKHNPPMWWSPTFRQVHAKQFAITAFATGQWARLLYQMDDAGMIAKGLEVLRKELGETIPDPVQTYIQNWTADPLAGGVYSVVAPGGKACRNYLSQPTEDKLYWAGEATAPNAWAATVHGAYLAGRRAAKEVLEVSNV